MRIEHVLESEKNSYDNFVSQHVLGIFLQSWDWGEWQRKQGKKVVRYFFVTDADEVIGTAQAILTNTPMGNYFYCPYGPLWNVKLEGNEIKTLLSLLKEELKKTDEILFVRIEPTIQADLKRLGAVKAESIQPPQTLIKDITPTEDDLLKSFHQKTRYSIRVAQRHGVKITAVREVNNEVIELIAKTVDRQGYRNHSKEYIRSLWQFFEEYKGNLKVIGYIAHKDNTPLASGLMVDYGQNRMYLFGGSDYAQRQFMGSSLLHWQAILDAKKSGLKQYDFGAIENASGHSGGYMRFKMGFNPKMIPFSGTHDLVVKPVKYNIYKSLRTINRIRLHLSK